MSVGAWEPGEDEHEDETTCLLLVHPCTLLFFWIKTIKTSRPFGSRPSRVPRRVDLRVDLPKSNKIIRSYRSYLRRVDLLKIPLSL